MTTSSVTVATIGPAGFLNVTLYLGTTQNAVVAKVTVLAGGKATFGAPPSSSTPLADGTTYNVVATTTGSGPLVSDPVVFTTKNVAPTTAPGGISVSATSSTISVRWTAMAKVTGYTIALSGEPSITITQRGTSTTFTGLAPSTSYTLSVAGLNESGTGPAATRDVRTLATAPTKPAPVATVSPRLTTPKVSVATKVKKAKKHRVVTTVRISIKTPRTSKTRTVTVSLNPKGKAKRTGKTVTRHVKATWSTKKKAYVKTLKIRTRAAGTVDVDVARTKTTLAVTSRA